MKDKVSQVNQTTTSSASRGLMKNESRGESRRTRRSRSVELPAGNGRNSNDCEATKSTRRSTSQRPTSSRLNRIGSPSQNHHENSRRGLKSSSKKPREHSKCTAKPTRTRTDGETSINGHRRSGTLADGSRRRSSRKDDSGRQERRALRKEGSRRTYENMDVSRSRRSLPTTNGAASDESKRRDQKSLKKQQPRRDARILDASGSRRSPRTTEADADASRSRRTIEAALKGSGHRRSNGSRRKEHSSHHRREERSRRSSRSTPTEKPSASVVMDDSNKATRVRTVIEIPEDSVMDGSARTNRKTNADVQSSTGQSRQDNESSRRSKRMDSSARRNRRVTESGGVRESKRRTKADGSSRVCQRLDRSSTRRDEMHVSRKSGRRADDAIMNCPKPSTYTRSSSETTFSRPGAEKERREGTRKNSQWTNSPLSDDEDDEGILRRRHSSPKRILQKAGEGAMETSQGSRRTRMRSTRRMSPARRARLSTSPPPQMLSPPSHTPAFPDDFAEVAFDSWEDPFESAAGPMPEPMAESLPSIGYVQGEENTTIVADAMCKGERKVSFDNRILVYEYEIPVREWHNPVEPSAEEAEGVGCWRGLEHLQNNIDKSKHIKEHVVSVKIKMITLQRKLTNLDSLDITEELAAFSRQRTEEDATQAKLRAHEDAQFVLEAVEKDRITDEEGRRDKLALLNPVNIVSTSSRFISHAVLDAGENTTKMVSGTINVATDATRLVFHGATGATDATRKVCHGALGATSDATRLVCNGVVGATNNATKKATGVFSSAANMVHGATTSTTKFVSTAVAAPIRGATSAFHETPKGMESRAA